MGRDREGTNQLFRLDTKATCFICFKPVAEAGSGSSTISNENCLEAPEEDGASPGTYSLRNICRHLKLDMEMVQLLINHGEEDEAQKSGHDDPTPAKDILPELKVSLCEACGMVVTRFSELFRKQELIRMEMGSCLGVVGGLLADADKDVPLIQQFHQRMTANISSRSFLSLRAVDELRKEMAEKCMEVAKKYPAPATEEIDRVARVTLGNSGAETLAGGLAIPASGSRKRRRKVKVTSPMPGSSRTIPACASILGIPAAGRAPPGPRGESRKKRRRKVALPIPGSSRTIPTCMNIGIVASPPSPLPPHPSPLRSLFCNQCGTTFKFLETLQAHLKIVHGLVLVQEESPQPPVAASRPKAVNGKRLESSQIQRYVRRGANGGFKSRVNAASTSTTSAQAQALYQQQEPTYADLSGADADDDFVEVDITDMDDELTMALVAPAPVDDDDDGQDNVFEADPAPWDTFLSGLLDTSDPSEESTSSVVIARPNSESSTGTETGPAQEPRLPKRRPMPQLINLAPKLPKPGRGVRKPKSGTEAEYVFNPQTGRYDCPRCSKSVGTAGACQRHFRTIHLKIRYACEQCGKTFSSKQTRMYHQQSQHMGIRVKCELCDATFKYPSDLSSHRHSVHFGKSYGCNYCSRSFSTSHSRNRHQRKCQENISHQPVPNL